MAGLAVTDDSLTQCVSELRQAFGDRGPALLRTLPRRGYMLAATVGRAVAAPAPPVAAPTAGGEPGRGATARELLVVGPIELAVDGNKAKHLARTLGAELLAALSRSEIATVVTRPSDPAGKPYRLSGVLLEAGCEPLLSLTLDEMATSRVVWADQVPLPPAAARREALEVLRARIEIHLMAEALHRARRMPPAQRGRTS